jgi:hypothetical protein
MPIPIWGLVNKIYVASKTQASDSYWLSEQFNGLF